MTDVAIAEARDAAERRRLAVCGAAELIAASQYAPRIKALLAIAGMTRLARAIDRVEVVKVADVGNGICAPDAAVWSAQCDEMIGA